MCVGIHTGHGLAVVARYTCVEVQVSVGVGVVTRTDSGLASAVNGRCECGSRWEQWVHENSGSVRVGQ
jgi:hypothetical protein